MLTRSVSHFVDIQTRKAQYINPKATVTLFGINPPSLRYHPVQLPCDQAPLLNMVVARTDCLVSAHTQNHLPAYNPLHVTAVANVHTHHTQVMRSPVHTRNTNHMSFIQYQSFNLTTCVGSSVLWCSSPRHHHFCIPKIEILILGFFLIPLVKSFVLKIQRDPQDRFLIASKLTKL